MLYSDLRLAKAVYQKGENVTAFLRQQYGTDCNTPDIIEIAYDLQAGSYIKQTRDNRGQWNSYTSELAGILARFYRAGDSVLDVGTGEMTTLVGVANLCFGAESDCYACDISLSRLQVGSEFVAEELKPELKEKLQPVVADLFRLPFADATLDIVWTSHSLEPNGGREKEALAELLRVTRKKLILFEPYYEGNSAEGRRRMESLGYVKGLPAAIEELGGCCEEIVAIRNTANPLNPTFAFIVTPNRRPDEGASFWACPASRLPMTRMEDCFWSEHSMLVYPIIRGIPVLRCEAGILASTLK